MSLSVSVKADVDAVLRDVSKVERRLVKRAAALSLNRVINTAKSQAAKEMKNRTGIKVTTFRKRMKLSKAKSNRLAAAIWAGLLRITAKDLGKPRQLRAGAKAGQFFFPGAFVTKLKSGSAPNVFKRKGAARHPVQTQGIEISVDMDQVLLKQINTVQAKRWNDIFNSQLERLLKRRF